MFRFGDILISLIIVLAVALGGVMYLTGTGGPTDITEPMIEQDADAPAEMVEDIPDARPAEDAMEAADSAAEMTEDAMEEAADAAEDATEDAMEEAADAMEDAADIVDEAAEAAGDAMEDAMDDAADAAMDAL